MESKTNRKEQKGKETKVFEPWYFTHFQNRKGIWPMVINGGKRKREKLSQETGSSVVDWLLAIDFDASQIGGESK